MKLHLQSEPASTSPQPTPTNLDVPRAQPEQLQSISSVTVAILAQGTSLADAEKQAFLELECVGI